LLHIASQIRKSAHVHSLLIAVPHGVVKRSHPHLLSPTIMSAPAPVTTPAHPASSAAPGPTEPTEDELAARAMQEVVPGLWLGALEATQLLGALRARGIDRVVSAIDLPEFEVDAVRRLAPV
jgi:hypothetical protein